MYDSYSDSALNKKSNGTKYVRVGFKFNKIYEKKVGFFLSIKLYGHVRIFELFFSC